ncbi:hypothetical protein AALA22_08980 [Anaerovoracaceae bacterium 41-7]
MFDGDLLLVIDNKTMIKGVDRDVPVVMDVEDKITALAEEDTPENRVALVLRTINSLIGETSNCASCYHNKMPKDTEVKKKYENYVDLLSVVNGKAIDYAKTGVLYNIPKHIAKYSKPLPYFMKYASEYYGSMSKFSNAPSNMNRLCKDLEHWDKTQRYTRNSDFNWRIMIDETKEVSEELQEKINKLYIEFCKEMSNLQFDQRNIRKYGDDALTPYDAKNFMINWGYYYDKYKIRCLELCDDIQTLANAAIKACYECYPQKKNSKFAWRVAGEGIILNLNQQVFPLPIRDVNGEYEYLGRKYSFADIQLDKGDENDN